MERRHRHLRQGRRRDARRGRGQGQRRDPGRRRPAAGPGGRRGREPRRHPARPDRVRPAAAAEDQHATRSTTPPAWTAPTTKSTSRSCWTGWSRRVSWTAPGRNALLAEMTDDVAELVLGRQPGAERGARPGPRPGHRDAGHPRADDRRPGRPDRARPGAGGPARHRTRSPSARPPGTGLCSPELAVLLAHAKLDLKAELLRTDVPDLPELRRRCWPPSSRPGWPRGSRTAVAAHPLRREIVATALVNELVNRGGITFAHRLADRRRRRPRPTRCARSGWPPRSSSCRRSGRRWPRCRSRCRSGWSTGSP